MINHTMLPGWISFPAPTVWSAPHSFQFRLLNQKRESTRCTNRTTVRRCSVPNGSRRKRLRKIISVSHCVLAINYFSGIVKGFRIIYIIPCARNPPKRPSTLPRTDWKTFSSARFPEMKNWKNISQSSSRAKILSHSPPLYPVFREKYTPYFLFSLHVLRSPWNARIVSCALVSGLLFCCLLWLLGRCVQCASLRTGASECRDL